MKSIVCFGDSNTWGYTPGTGERYPYPKRWTSVLQRELGSGYLVIPEGLNGRTTVFEDPVSGDKNGLQHLKTVLESHKPIDLIVIMLGTNDLKNRFNLRASEIARAARQLVEAVLRSECGPGGTCPAIILASPAPIVHSESTSDEFSGAIDTSKLLKKTYQELADTLAVPCIHAGDYVSSSPVDGIHWSAEAHERFGTGIAGLIRTIV
jgi:lysophospholipase L1-like esterase